MTRDDSGAGGVLRWWFEDRATGRIVVAQAPSWSLWTFIVAFAASAALRAFDSALAKPVGAFGAIALTIWALDEIARGCNPFRRVLGALILVVLAVRWFPR